DVGGGSPRDHGQAGAQEARRPGRSEDVVGMVRRRRPRHRGGVRRRRGGAVLDIVEVADVAEVANAAEVAISTPPRIRLPAISRAASGASPSSQVAAMAVITGTASCTMAAVQVARPGSAAYQTL